MSEFSCRKFEAVPFSIELLRQLTLSDLKDK